MSCNLRPSHLIKPSRTLPIDTAKETCDKIEIGSFGPKWANLRKKLYDNEAYKKHCWHGSRMMTWIPHIRQLDGSLLGVETWQIGAWNEGPRTECACAIAYMGEAEKMESNIWKTECTQRAYVWTLDRML